MRPPHPTRSRPSAATMWEGIPDGSSAREPGSLRLAVVIGGRHQHVKIPDKPAIGTGVQHAICAGFPGTRRRECPARRSSQRLITIGASRSRLIASTPHVARWVPWTLHGITGVGVPMPITAGVIPAPFAGTHRAADDSCMEIATGHECRSLTVPPPRIAGGGLRTLRAPKCGRPRCPGCGRCRPGTSIAYRACDRPPPDRAPRS